MDWFIISPERRDKLQIRECNDMRNDKTVFSVLIRSSIEEINPSDYDILILPGEKAPEAIRKKTEALNIAKHFFEDNKPVAAICHGPQTLISAGLLKGRHATCYRSVAEELKASCAIYEDKEVVVDRNLITSRQPSDLPAFLREIMKALKE